jgi:methyltransferase-like protein
LGGYTAAGRLVELSTQPPAFTLEIGERPVASPLSRLQARTGKRVTNMRHESIPVPEVARYLLQYLDGSRDRQALADLVVQLGGEGKLDIEEAGQPVYEAQQARELAARAVEQQLAEIARHALLVA